MNIWYSECTSYWSYTSSNTINSIHGNYIVLKLNFYILFTSDVKELFHEKAIIVFILALNLELDMNIIELKKSRLSRDGVTYQLLL